MKPNGLNGPTSGLRAQRLDNRDPAKQYGTGRTCGEEGCEARLSRYNGHDYCRLHSEMHPVRIRPEESTTQAARSRQKLRALERAER